MQSKCSGLQNGSTDELRTGYASLSVPHPFYHNRYHHQFQREWHRQQTELCELLERHNVKVAVIQETLL